MTDPVSPPAPGTAGRTWRALRGWVILAAVIAAGWAVMRWVVMRPTPVEVRVAAVERGVVEHIVSNTRAGSVRSRADAMVAAEQPGHITAIAVDVGDRVAKGAVLCRLDPATAQAGVRVAERDLDYAKAQATRSTARVAAARREVGRLKALREHDAAAPAELEAAQTELDVAVADAAAATSGIARADARLAQARLAIERCTVRAPFAGVVAERLADLGELAVAGAPLLRLVDDARLYIYAELDEIDIAQLAAGLSARVTLDAYPGRTFAAKIVLVSPVVSERLEQNRTVAVEAVLDTVPGGVALRPGTSADVAVVLERSAGDALRVPTLAVLDGDAVLVVDGGVARRRSFEAGLQNWEWTEVRGGLAGGAQVITSLDREEVKDGALVTIAADGGP